MKGDTTSKQMKLQTKRTCKTDICISFSHKKILFRQERMVSNVLTKTVVHGFGWDMIKNKKEISTVSNKTMLIIWLKIFFSRASCCCGKLDHWTGSPARLLEEWINKLCFQMILGTLISFYCDLTQFISMIVSY